MLGGCSSRLMFKLRAAFLGTFRLAMIGGAPTTTFPAEPGRACLLVSRRFVL